MSPSGCRLSGALFLSFAVLFSSPVAGKERPYHIEIDNSAAGAVGEWGGEALELYLDSFVGEVSSSLPPNELPPFSVKVRVLTEGKDLVYLMRLETGEGQIAESELRGAPAEAARWLRDLALVVERTILPDSDVSSSWQGPASSTPALRLFLDSGKTESFEARTRLLQDALAMDPAFAEARWQLGVVLYAWGRFAEALDAFEKYLEVRPSSSRAAHNSGLCADRVGYKSGEGETAADTEDFFLAPYHTASSPVWFTALPEVGEAWAGDVKEGSVSAPARRESGDPPKGDVELPAPEEDSSSAEVEKYRRRNRALEEIAREKDLLAIRLAREALAAQKELRETRERILELEGGKAASAGTPPAKGDTAALREDLAEAEAELKLLRAETRSQEKEKEKLAETLVAEEATVLALEEISRKAADKIALLEKEREELRERNTLLASRVVEVEKAGEDAASLRDRLKEGREEYEALEKKGMSLTAEAKELGEEAAALGDSLEEERQGREALVVELAERTGEVQKALEETASLRGSFQEAREKKEQLEKKLEKEGELRRICESEAQEKEAAVAALRDDIARGESAVKEAEEAAGKCETRAAKAEERAAETLTGKVVLEESVAALQLARASVEGELAERNEDLQAAVAKEEASRQREAALTREKAGLEERLGELGNRLAALEKEIAAGQSSAGELETIRGERDSLVVEKEQLEAAAADRGEESESLWADLSRLQADLDMERQRTLVLERERDELEELKLRLVKKVKEATMRSLALEKGAASP